MNGDLIIFRGKEAICYFNLQKIKGQWHADILFTESRVGDLRTHIAPWSEINFINDKDGERKRGYMKDHLRDLEKRKREKKPCIRVTGKIKKMSILEMLTKNLLWSMN